MLRSRRTKRWKYTAGCFALASIGALKEEREERKLSRLLELLRVLSTDNPRNSVRASARQGVIRQLRTRAAVYQAGPGAAFSGLSVAHS